MKIAKSTVRELFRMSAQSCQKRRKEELPSSSLYSNMALICRQTQRHMSK